MTPDEFRAILDRLGATPAAFASLVGAAPREAQRWAAGTRPVPPAVVTLARVADGVAGRLPYGELAALLRAEAARLDGVTRPQA